jgi:hypothetical protein
MPLSLGREHDLIAHMLTHNRYQVHRIPLAGTILYLQPHAPGGRTARTSGR